MRIGMIRVFLPTLLALAALSLPARAVPDGFDPRGSGPGYPETASGRGAETPSLAAQRIGNGAIEIDGRLDEPDWIAAPAATGFTQFEPERGGEPCEETVFKVLYDEDAIYFGVACYRLNGEPITSCLSRRDNIRASDRIRIYIDPYHDLTTGYHFRINPHGVKEDYYNYGDLYHDISWDAVWEADTHIDDEGWYAEIRLPFSSVRYRAAESMTWGFNIFQYIHSQGERTAWSNWDRDLGGFMSRSGTITGIRGVRPPRQLEVTPYVMGSLTDPSDPTAHGYGDEEWDDFGNFGADLKYGVTADLTLNATIQPDFGQVEADPSVLNLSPYETYYDEKRPFFVEGQQFFWHPDFTVFYSRRIGTGTENSRIRFASKLTGKMTGNISTAVLLAATDETREGQAHNTLKGGESRALYAIGRFGKQFHGGMHSVNLMQTAVVRDKDSFETATRNGYVTGADFELNFKERMYRVSGSFVGSIVDPLADPSMPETDPDPIYGTGGQILLSKDSGTWRGSVSSRLAGDKLDINDLGYISQRNHYGVEANLEYVYNPDNDASWIRSASSHTCWNRSWIYAGRTFDDPRGTGQALWSYDRGHELDQFLHLCAHLDTRSCWSFWCGSNYHPEGTDFYATRFTPDGRERGPLMTRPSYLEAWGGFCSDYRKDLSFEVEVETYRNDAGSRQVEYMFDVAWIQSNRLNHELSLSHDRRHIDAQWVENFATPGGGLGEVSYVFAELDQRTWDLTLRSRVLFSRDQSLELYIQPYLTVGDYSNARELARPDSYELTPYGGDNIAARDFAYGAVNLNMVYRWEYRPGSTLFLVWAHGRERFDTRAGAEDPDRFDNGFGTDPLIDNEPENRFMVKVTYWLPI